MASTDKESELEEAQREFMPNSSWIKPTLDSICAEIENSLPTIDFEISDVSSEEDVPIFHRALRTPTQDEVSDRVGSSMEESTLPKLDQLNYATPNIRHLTRKSQKFGQQNSPREFQKPTDLTSGDANSNKMPIRPQSAAINSNDDSSERRPRAALHDNWVNDYSLNNDIDIEIPSPTLSPRTEKRSEIPELSLSDKQKQRKGDGGGDSKQLVSRYLPEAPTIKLDNIDLDFMVSGVFERLPEDLLTISTNPSEHTMDKDEPSLIQKLAQLSMNTSGTQLSDIDATSGALKLKIGELKELKTARNMSVSTKSSAAAANKPIVQPSKLIAKDLVNLPRSQLSPSPSSRKKEEPETVFIDLRRFDEQREQQKQSVERVQRVLGLSAQDESSDSSDDEAVSWIEQRQIIKRSLHETGTLPNNWNRVQPNPHQNKVTHVAHRTQAQKLVASMTAISRPPPVLMATEENTPQLTDAEKDREEKLEAARKLREQREHERLSRIRLGQRLDALRPTLSDKGHYDCAENTPTLFDIGASYEPQPLPLPSELMDDVELVLLSIHLSCNGEMVSHRGPVHKSVDKGSGLSASYNSLVAWFLSLVPDNFDFLRVGLTEATFAPAPFYVIGLQQMYINKELRLFVAVTPVEHFTPRDAPGRMRGKAKKRDDLRDASPFQQILNKYFAVNTLPNVCLWLQDMVSMEVMKGSVSGMDEDQFVYRPPLPSITTKPLSTFIHINPDVNAAAKIFHSTVGFYWQTLETDESQLKLNLDDKQWNLDTQNTMSLMYKRVYRDARAMMGILNRVLQEGLELAGLRLLYPTPDLLNMAANILDNKPQGMTIEMLNNIGPIVSLALRGSHARSIWLDAVGPSDPVLARRTDPNSLCAMYGGETRDECLLFCPRNPDRVHSELCRWFAGRVPASGVIDIGHSSRDSSQLPGKKGKKSLTNPAEDILHHNPVSLLSASTKSDVVIALSPLVPTRCLGLILATCQRRGYQLHGVKHSKLSAKRAGILGLTGLPLTVYLNEDLPLYADIENDGPTLHHLSRPVTLLLLQKENAMHSVASLVEAFMVQLCLQGELGKLAGWLQSAGCQMALSSSLMFHAVPYSDSLISGLGGDFSKVPEAHQNSTPGYITPRLHTNPELEQVVILTLTGHQLLKTFGLFLGRLLGVTPYTKIQAPSPVTPGFELLGMKWLPSLGLQQSKELTPFEVGEPAWKPSLHKLTSEPAVVLALRGVDAFRRIESFLALRDAETRDQHQLRSRTLETIMSPTPEMAYRQATMFFHKWELHPDPSAQLLTKYLPPMNQQKSDECTPVQYSESIFEMMLSGPQPITSLLLCKPNVVQRHLSKVLRHLTQEGFRIVALHLIMLDKASASFAVPHEDRDDDILFSMHIDYLCSAPCLVMTVQRENAVKKLLDLLGPSDPKHARRQNVGLWRGIFGSDPICNGLHASCDYESAIAEIKHFFPDGLCCKQTDDLANAQICGPCEDRLLDLCTSKQRQIIMNDCATALQDLTTAKKSSGNMTKAFSLHISALTQTSCIVLCPSLLQTEHRHRRSPFVDVLDLLLSKGFDLVAARLIWLTEKQAQIFLHIIEEGNFNRVPLLVSGPSLVLAVQRDNAVMAFDSLLGRTYETDSLFNKHSHQIMRPKNTAMADQLLCYFFKELIPAAHVKIVQQT